jgi:hypothetical protein
MKNSKNEYKLSPLERGIRGVSIKYSFIFLNFYVNPNDSNFKDI